MNAYGNKRLSVANRLGNIVFTSIAFNDRLRIDNKKSNHLNSTLQVLSFGLWRYLYPEIFHTLNIGKKRKKTETHVSSNGITSFERDSHEERFFEEIKTKQANKY